MTLRSTDYALLAQESYHDSQVDADVKLDGVAYKVFATTSDELTGFQATAYQRQDTGEVVIAYRGTEFDREPVRDGGVDAGMVLLGVNAQAPASEAFTRQVIEKAKHEAELNDREPQITVTGHSLGGTLAEINAAKYGLHGETFNAYGAASLKGIPEGGDTVIDHVRAGDLVSAASPHYGQVRVYAAQQDIDTLQHAGYRDDSGILSLRNPIKATNFDAHAIDNFVPNSKLLGQSIISPENVARYDAHKGMVDRYRDDVADIRKGISAPWEIPKAIGELKDTLEHEAFELAGKGILAVEHGFEHLKEEISEGIHAVEERASSAWHTLTHPKEWFEHDKPKVTLDHPDHPDHALFKQAQGAVHTVDASHGRTPDKTSDQVAGSLVVSARRDGLERVDRAVLSDDANRLYGVQGAVDSPLKQVTEVNTATAAQTSLQQSSAAWQQQAEIARQNQATSQAQRMDQQVPPQAPAHGM